MKYTSSFKLRLTAVTALMSLTCLVHAGTGNLQRTYRQMSSVLNTMEHQTNEENLSNTYSGKLFNNIDSLKKDLTQATFLSRGSQSSGGNGLSILIELAADAADTGAIHNFSAEARDNIADELDNSLDTLTDQDLINGANDVLNILDEAPASGVMSAPRVDRVRSTAPRRNRNFQYRRQPWAQKQHSSESGLSAPSSSHALSHPSSSTAFQQAMAKMQQGRHTESSRTLSEEDKKRILFRSSSMPAQPESRKSGFFTQISSRLGGKKAESATPSKRLLVISTSDVAQAPSQDTSALTSVSAAMTSAQMQDAKKRAIEIEKERELKEKREAEARAKVSEASKGPQPAVVDTVAPTSPTPVVESKKKKFQAGLTALQVPALDTEIAAKPKFEREKIGDFSETDGASSTTLETAEAKAKREAANAERTATSTAQLEAWAAKFKRKPAGNATIADSTESGTVAPK